MAGGDHHRSALDRLTGLVPVDAVLRNVDIQALLDRIDMNELLDRIDVNAIVARVDFDDVVARMDLGSIVERSVHGAASGGVDEVRAASLRLDRWITRRVDRLLRRSPGWRPLGPRTMTTSA